MKLVEIKNVSKQFVNHRALDNVSFDIEQGHVLGLLGPNGAGKTTLIRILNQITIPDEGEIIFQGRPLQRNDIERIGYLPEERGLYKKMKVGEQSVYLAQLKGLTRGDAEKRLHHWFKKFDIEPWWNKKMDELSKGMQQKIQFIVTLIHEPSFLILDEPFSGFDPINANLLKAEILELKKRGTTIIISTHNMASVEEICDDIVLINQSKKILSGSLKEIKLQNRLNQYALQLANVQDSFYSAMESQMQILSETKSDAILDLVVKIDPGMTSNQLLSAIIPHAEVCSFNEILPSMNDIFIKTVKANS